MARITVRTTQQTVAGPLPPGFAGDGQAAAYFGDDGQPLRLHVVELKPGQGVTIGGAAIDKLVYVWRGAVVAGGRALDAGSSLIVEHGSSASLTATEPATLLAFSSAQAPAQPLAGGHVHLLPAERAPRTDSLGGSVGLGGVMHADSDAGSNEIWLHENRFPPMIERQDAEAGIHSHSEDEIIFVLDGDIRLGERLYGPGTAVAIAADTLYSFTAGPQGLHFANFRAARPGDIRFAKGHAISETGYWRERLPRPEYLSPAE